MQVVRGVQLTTPSPKRESGSRLSNSFSEELQAVLGPSAGRRSDPYTEEMNRKTLSIFMNGESGESPRPSSSSVARLAPCALAVHSTASSRLPPSAVALTQWCWPPCSDEETDSLSEESERLRQLLDMDMRQLLDMDTQQLLDIDTQQ